MKLCLGGSKAKLIAYLDSDLAGDIDGRKSTSGYLVTHSGEQCHGKAGCRSVWI
jgi:hypothetical protein